MLEIFIQCENIGSAGASARRKSAFLVTGDAVYIEAIIFGPLPRNDGASFLSATIHDDNQTKGLERRCSATPKKSRAGFAYLLRDCCGFCGHDVTGLRYLAAHLVISA